MDIQRSEHRTLRILALAGMVSMLIAPVFADPPQSESNKRPFTSDFPLEDCTWVTHDGGSPGNPLFPIVPGEFKVLTNEDEDEEITITICLDDGSNCSTHDGTPVLGVKTVLGVPTRVIEERELEDGDLAEISHNFFSRCEENNGIFYWGEDVEDVEDDEVVGNEGAWIVGEEDALPGLVMPGQFLLGARYFQEFAPGVAEDRGENVGMGLDVTVLDEEDLSDCVEVFETSGLSASDRSTKFYCPEVGLVWDDGAVLTDLGP